MSILNGRILAKIIQKEIKQEIQRLKQKPGLAIILVGDDPASHLYVSLKEKACKQTGIHFEKIIYEEKTPEEILINKIAKLNNRSDIHGILVQLPLPGQNPDNVITAIDPKKDVDGFHPKNLTLLEEGKPCLVPAVVLGIIKLIDETKHDLSGKKAVIISSDIFAKPLLKTLRNRSLNTEVIRWDNVNLAEKTKTADVLICAIGKPNFIKGEIIKKGAIVIDVGTTRVGNKVVGDIEQESAKQIARFLTPVPGGVGPMTVAMLLKNVLEAHRIQTGVGNNQKIY